MQSACGGKAIGRSAVSEEGRHPRPRQVRPNCPSPHVEKVWPRRRACRGPFVRHLMLMCSASKRWPYGCAF